MCIFSILFLQWWLVSWYFSFCSGNHVLASIKILFSMTNKTPCSPPQYMQGRFWFWLEYCMPVPWLWAQVVPVWAGTLSGHRCCVTPCHARHRPSSTCFIFTTTDNLAVHRSNGNTKWWWQSCLFSWPGLGLIYTLPSPLSWLVNRQNIDIST